MEQGYLRVVAGNYKLSPLASSSFIKNLLAGNLLRFGCITAFKLQMSTLLQTPFLFSLFAHVCVLFGFGFVV